MTAILDVSVTIFTVGTTTETGDDTDGMTTETGDDAAGMVEIWAIVRVMV